MERSNTGRTPTAKIIVKPCAGKRRARLCVQRIKLVCLVGDNPTKVKSQSLVAWIAGRRETESLKPIDKAIFKDGERVIGPQRK